MANEFSSIDCNEEITGAAAPSSSESYDIQGNFTAKTTLRVTAANKDALISDILGNQRPWPNSSFTVKPYAHKVTNVRPASIDTTVDITTKQNYVIQEYLLDVEYTTAPEQQLLAVTIEPFVDVIRLDHRYFRWSGGAPLTEAEAPGIIRPKYALKRQIFGAALVPTALLNYPGAVHNASYTDPDYGFSFPAETLMLQPEPITTKITTSGSDGFNYTVVFLYNPNTWNKFYKSDTNSYETIHAPDGTQVKNYPPQNLSSLL